MRIGSEGFRLRTFVSMGVLAVGVPMVAVASVHHSSADTGLNTSSVGTAVSGTVGTVSGATSNLSGTSSAPKAGTALSGTTANTASSSANCPTSGLPADKMTVAAATTDVAGPNADITVLAACMRTSNPADLLFQLTSECEITTDVATTGNNSSMAQGTIQMWIEIDGQTVGVIPAHQGASSDDGHVTFCDRAHTQTTSGFVADQNGKIDENLDTMDANGFNWVAMNVGNGIHFITVHAELSQNTAGDATAMENIRKRTLVVQTTETAQNMAG